mmetsp:Transcript_22243/g.56143  ORF Transcript_22243/g.56143 Transcript_22243/m.56143 type:complete len:262 (-) Transcript_22243:641-1426(-)
MVLHMMYTCSFCVSTYISSRIAKPTHMPGSRPDLHMTWSSRITCLSSIVTIVMSASPTFVTFPTCISMIPRSAPRIGGASPVMPAPPSPGPPGKAFSPSLPLAPPHGSGGGAPPSPPFGIPVPVPPFAYPPSPGSPPPTTVFCRMWFPSVPATLGLFAAGVGTTPEAAASPRSPSSPIFASPSTRTQKGPVAICLSASTSKATSAPELSSPALSNSHRSSSETGISTSPDPGAYDLIITFFSSCAVFVLEVQLLLVSTFRS